MMMLLMPVPRRPGVHSSEMHARVVQPSWPWRPTRAAQWASVAHTVRRLMQLQREPQRGRKQPCRMSVREGCGAWPVGMMEVIGVVGQGRAWCGVALAGAMSMVGAAGTGGMCGAGGLCDHAWSF